MPKQARPKNIKGPGKCIYCGGGAVPGNPMTREHLWSIWIDDANLLPKFVVQYVETAKKFRRYTGETKDFHRERQGAPYNKTIKVVCQTCNSGWMGTIETAVQPILTPLIKGQKIRLTQAKRRTLTEWITLKMLVAEHSGYRDHELDPIFTQADRNAFMYGRMIPSGVRIYLVRQESIVWATGYKRHASGLGQEPPSFPPQKDPTGTKNVQAITWGLGRLLVYISAVTDPQIRPHFRFVKGPEFRRLWPLTQSDVNWPPPIRVDDAFVEDLAGALGRYLDASMG
jgi:hypothetical protein